MLNKKAKTMVIAIPLAAVIGFGGYSAFMGQFPSLAGEDKNPETVILSKDFPATSDLNQMINEADVVVIGEYEGLDSKWNMARNPNNPLEEDKENYVEGHLYNFNISETIKGTTENKKIKINHRFAETVKLEDSDAVVAPDGTIKKEATKVVTKDVENKDPLYIEPKISKKYMMFLKKDQLFGNYYGAIEPFAITFDENNKAELQTNIETINEKNMTSKAQFAGKTVVLKNEIHETITDNISGKTLNEVKEQVKQNVK
ncbi:cardiolipin synthase [Bacillus sp. DX4.1]|uniref:cardiolipin synthase n=1 Tax=Bacillus sp. DX4.1 TaxID=3055867 RepID=UPI0025A21665|nr:cardiolipin synthase [Bacillus sp. DX4.1]MDM5188799.1 cardiolipin synthase [Bacillus sp. DX4.1]